MCLFQTDGVHSKADLKQSNRSPGIYLHAKPMIFVLKYYFYKKICYFALSYYINHVEGLSEAVKLLKADYLVKAINAHKMDQAIVFCRTKLDCDNIENYLQSLGGGQDTLRILSVYSQYTIIIVGPKSMVNEYSCVCLHGDRRPQERKDNLQKFKVQQNLPLIFSAILNFVKTLIFSPITLQEGEVRFLICTDVAARGIDITGIPYVVNVTLPDDKQNYVHRIGRVGRAERMGLAISLVSKVKEKVSFAT